jgi:hypothetical protein
MDKSVLAVENSGSLGSGKKANTEVPGKEAAACADCRETAVAGKAGKSDGPYCKIHRTKGHNLQECHQVEQLAKKQRAEYEKRNKERNWEGSGGKAAAKKDTMARPLRRTAGPTKAVRRKKKRKVMGEMMKVPASTSSKERLKPCVLTEVPPCPPLPASSSSGREKSMLWSQLLTLGGH